MPSHENRTKSAFSVLGGKDFPSFRSLSILKFLFFCYLRCSESNFLFLGSDFVLLSFLLDLDFVRESLQSGVDSDPKASFMSFKMASGN